MAKRSITIEEEHGIFRIRNDNYIFGSGMSLERALLAASPGTQGWDESFAFNAAELLEPLLGEKRTDVEGAVAP